MSAQGRLERAARDRTEAIVADLAVQALASRVRGMMSSDPAVRQAVEAAIRRDSDPRTAASVLLERVCRGSG
jgi:hypothetical protein